MPRDNPVTRRRTSPLRPTEYDYANRVLAPERKAVSKGLLSPVGPLVMFGAKKAHDSLDKSTKSIAESKGKITEDKAYTASTKKK